MNKIGKIRSGAKPGKKLDQNTKTLYYPTDAQIYNSQIHLELL